jgi:hypothetical protein
VARIRTVKPEFFRHEELFEAEQASGLPLRLAYAGLWIVADREGRFRWRPRNIKLDVMPFDDVDFEAVLNELATRKFIVKYEVGGEIFAHIPKWSKHQHVNQREAASDLPAPDEDGASTCVHIPARVEGKGKGKEGEGECADAQPTPDKNSLAVSFAEFRKAYPQRKGSNPWEPARLKFEAAVKSGVDPEQIISAARRYAVEQRELKNVNTEFVMQATRWLNAKSWQDYGPPAGVDGSILSMTWVGRHDPSYALLEARHERETGRKPAHNDGTGGPGRWWPNEWLADIPASLKRTPEAA